MIRVTNAAAVVCWTFCIAKAEQRPSGASHSIRGRAFATIMPYADKLPILGRIMRILKLNGRNRVTYSFAIFFLALTILLEVRLNGWSTSPDATLGSCYRTDRTANPGASHPSADKIYVAISSTWMLLVMLLAIFGGARWRKFILGAAFLQYPVHMYFMITLRLANQSALESETGESEDDWDFGQTAAILLFGIAVMEFWRKSIEFIQFERETRRKPDETQDVYSLHQFTPVDSVTTSAAMERAGVMESGQSKRQEAPTGS